ncbi:MAG: type II toxin-antitoxin system HicB family antitoxin, partial [Cyanobacteria bacterium]|nr:type II toxin-antitoxin system HicB family antitoxin [Cyanobacteria bacterium CG_2015-09_32_10]
MVEYTIIIEKAEGNYSAYCPDLPGCIATGFTPEETIQRMKEAIKFHLE